MKKWLRIVLIAVVAALTARWWLEPVLGFLGANSDVIQSLADAIQIVLWVAALIALILGWRQRSNQAPSASSPAKTVAHAGERAVIAQEGGVAGGDHSIPIGRDMYGDVILVANPDQVWQRIRKHLPAPDLRAATEAYLRHLVDKYQYLDFKGMGVSDRVALRLSLADMYVPLKARIEMPEGDTWSRQLRLAGRSLTGEEAEAVGMRLSEPMPVLDLLKKHDGLIILGDPGAGKTTFLKYLTLMLARGRGEALALSAGLPVLVPLSAYANALAEGEIGLDRFIADYYNSRGIELPLGEMLEEALARGGALILLDGLDEVRDPAQRRIVVDHVVDFFTMQRRRGNKFLLTSRIVGYRDVRPTVEGLGECTLVDFEEEEIEQFVERWTAAIERAARGDTRVAAQEAQRERAELLDAVRRNPGVRQLAANPLLLTILALMKRQGVTLPERRVELYEKYVETLLKNWNLARGLGRPSNNREFDLVETMKVLAPLALWMHKTSPGVGLVKQGDLQRELEAIYVARTMPKPDQAARRFLEDVRGYAGLLVERGPREYGFIHLTFQEYLAAVAIAQQGQKGVDPIVDILAAHVGEETWHEVTLLTVAYLGLIQQRDEAAGEVAGALIERGPGQPGEAVVLAGEAVLDAWPGGVTYDCRDKTVQALLQTMSDDGQIAPVRRAAAGRVLARLGDPRPGVGVVEGLPDIAWSQRIDPGPFPMGNNKPEAVYDNEAPRFTCRLITRPYFISRYAITVAQFRCFIQAGGYDHPDWWSKAGWQWRKEGRIIGPQPQGDPFDLDNHPQVGVSWYEAHAFCNWLAAQTGQDIHLPSEAQWERAARHSDARTYPWAKGKPADYCNMAGTGTGSICAVGLFPQGDSVCGAADMSGNVWEWCSTEWLGNYDRYEQKVSDDSEGSSARVLRGGAFGSNVGYVRCALRLDNSPHYRNGYYGFRVVFSPGEGGQAD